VNDSGPDSSAEGLPAWHVAVDEHRSLEAWVASFPIAESTIDRLRAVLVDA